MVCTIKLDKNGTGTCRVSTAGLRPGSVTYEGVYNGTGGFRSSTGTTTVNLKPPQQTS